MPNGVPSSSESTGCHVLACLVSLSSLYSRNSCLPHLDVVSVTTALVHNKHPLFTAQSVGLLGSLAASCDCAVTMYCSW